VRQFLLKEKPDKDGLVRLKDEDYHYLVHVRRLKAGHVFSALLPSLSSPRRVTVTVQSTDNHTLIGLIMPEAEEEISAVLRTEYPPIILFQALPKGARMDLIVRQAAEGGISEVVPFVSEHSVPRGHYVGRAERWRRIIKEARQQSGSAVNTRMHEVLSTDELFAYWEKLISTGEILGLLFTPMFPQGSPNPLAQGSFHRYLYKKPRLIILAVGPEGGFSGAEQKRFVDAGFNPLSLGPAVLRTETAALYGTAAVNIVLMEKAWWTLKQQ